MPPSQTDSEKQNSHHSHSTGYSYQDAYESWSQYYQQMATEGMAFFQKGLEATQKFTPFFPQPELYQVWTQSYQDFLSHLGHDPSQLGPDKFRELYDIWLETWSRHLEHYMRTPEFAAKSGKDLETFSEFSKQMGRLLEAYWESLHLPSSADMREIYHKLYLIERKLDEMDRRFRHFEATAETPKTASRKNS
jgi:hypothetical protein